MIASILRALAALGIQLPKLKAAANFGLLGAYAWADRPSAVTYSGYTIIVTDIGSHGGGSLWRSDGTSWQKTSAINIAEQQAQVVVSNTTTETQVFSTTIKGGCMGAKGKLRISVLFTCTNSGNSKTFKITLGGQNMYNVAGFAGVAALDQLHVIRNRSASTQVVTNNTLWGIGNATGVIATGTVDTTTNQTLACTVKMATTGETINLEYLFVELI